MKSARQQLMVMICLLAVLANGSSSQAQDVNPSAKQKAPVEVDFQMEMKLFSEGTFKYFGSKYFGKVVKNAPYSATAITEHVQTLGDGNQIIRKNEAKLYRDNEGRTRREQTLETIGKWTAAGDAPQMIYISDPVAGYSYNLDPRTRMARKGNNIKPFEYRQKTEEVNGKIERQNEERVKRNKEMEKEREKRNEERVKERTEQMKERQEQMKEQAKEREVRMNKQAKEREKQMKERAEERQERTKEWTKEREEQLKEREERTKERIKEHEKREKEQLREREDRTRELTKEREKEHIERSKQIEKQHKEIEKLAKEKTLAPDFALKSKESTGRKEISRSDANKKVDALGKQIIEGVEVEGTRSTRTIKAGEIGNTLPIEIVDENWYSQELQLQVMTKHSDPRSGVTTYRLTNISRNQPDRSLFEVPTDYTFKDESMPNKRVAKPEPSKSPESPKAPESSKKPNPAKAPESYL